MAAHCCELVWLRCVGITVWSKCCCVQPQPHLPAGATTLEELEAAQRQKRQQRAAAESSRMQGRNQQSVGQVGNSSWAIILWRAVKPFLKFREISCQNSLKMTEI